MSLNNMGLWDELHEDLLDQIVKRMTNHLDVVQFGLVCRSWSSVAMENRASVPKQLPLSFCFPQPKLNPVLILPSKGGLQYRNFWSVTENKLGGQFSLPETQGKWPCSASFGWLLMVDFEEPEEVVLYNPVTRAQIQLPPLSTFPKFPFGKIVDDTPKYYFIKKAVLSVDPSKDHENWILMVIVSVAQRLCFCRVKDRKWTVVGSDPLDRPAEGEFMQDVTYSNGRFYVVNRRANVYAIDAGSLGSVQPKFEALARTAHNYCATNYVVISSRGDLLLVSKNLWYDNEATDIRDYTYHTDEVVVYKLDSNNKQWEELEHLGDDVIFVGRNASLSLSRDKVPELKANCIYLADDIYVWSEDGTKVKCLDSGIYNYEDCSMQQLDVIGPYSHIPVLWIIPSISN